MSKADRTRQFIIEASAPLINKKGMAGTSLSDIMEVTKLAKGGIYGNFESKEEICRESFLYLRFREPVLQEYFPMLMIYFCGINLCTLKNYYLKKRWMKRLRVHF
ncbi:TetR family transcriptional regulator [Flavobacterium sp. LBUM151]